MPIRNLSDNVAAAFPWLGKIRKGAARSEDDVKSNRPGGDLKFFRFTSDRPEVEEAFEAAYGDQPTLINFFLPYVTVDENFECWKEAWTAGGLGHRCDGVTSELWLGKDSKYHKEPIPCPGGCKEVGRLTVLIPELLQVGMAGFVTVETHSLNDILSIQGSLEAAASMRWGHKNGLKGIPWKLRRQPEKISTPAKDGKRARREKWMLQIEPMGEWVMLQLEQARSVAMLQAPKPEPVVIETGELLGLPQHNGPDEDDDIQTPLGTDDGPEEPQQPGDYKPQPVAVDSEGLPVFDERDPLRAEIRDILSVDEKVGKTVLAKIEKKRKLTELNLAELHAIKPWVIEQMELSGVKVRNEAPDDTTVTGGPLPEGL